MLRITMIMAALAVATPAAAERDEASVRAWSAAEVRAVLERDSATIDRLFADDLLVNSPGNEVNDKAAVMRFLKTPGRIDYTAFDRTIERVVVEGDRALLMGGEVVVDRIGPRAGKPTYRRFTDVLRWEGGGWRMYARHANVIAPGTPNAPMDTAAAPPKP